MTEIEHRGDALRNELVVKLAGVPAAPIDREDLFRLSRSIDEVLDNLRDFVREWDLYGIEGTDAYLGLLDATASGVEDLRQAVRRSPRPEETSRRRSSARSRPTRSAPLRRRARPALSRRAHHGRHKVRELLRRLDVVGLRLNEAADVLSDAAVKRRV